MSLKSNKAQKINELTESSYVALYRITSSYARGFTDKLGYITELPLPVFELIKAVIYWHKSNRADFKDTKTKIALNRLFHFTMIAASIVALSMNAAGFGTISAILLVSSGYFNASRTLSKAVRSAVIQEENYDHKMANNLQKTLVTGLITTGILLMSFYPRLEYIGVICELVACGHLFLSSLPVMITKESRTLKASQEVIATATPHSVDLRKSTSSTNSMIRFSQRRIDNVEFLQNETAPLAMKRRNSI